MSALESRLAKLDELIAKVDQTHSKQDARDQDGSFSDEGQSRDSASCRTSEPFNQVSSPPSEHITGPNEYSMNISVPSVTSFDYPSTYASTSGEDSALEVISPEKAQSLLQVFRDMSTYFPFVMLPTMATVTSLSQERPFLFLAAVTAASSAEKPLQEALERECRSVLCTKALFEGEKSLDLLEGLLVYLAWFVLPILMTIRG